MDAKADIGLIGLAVMGQNLVLNMDDHDFNVAVYNRTTSKMTDFIAGPASGTNVEGFEELEDMIAALEKPRRVMLMVKAGDAVDKVIEQLLPMLDEGDIIIDGGNASHLDSIRHAEELEEKGFRYIGTGISGGEEGARNGPSIMPGGTPDAWPYVKDIFQSIAAHVDDAPCCDWVGENGAGHFVKMVHNGIEYGDMQLICEAYHLMSGALGMDADELAETFTRWNEGKLDSYLIEITGHIFQAKADDGTPLVDKILDTAGQKGTGKWTAVAALNEGVPLTLIGEAVFSRFLSSVKSEREKASEILEGPQSDVDIDKEAFIKDLEQALFAAKITSYAQGYMLMGAAAQQYGWDLNYSGVAQMWRGGCIIRSAFLSDIMEAYQNDEHLQNLLLAPFFKEQIDEAQGAWRRVVAKAVALGIPVPAMSSALAFYDGYRTARLPANLLQAQRDYFGAHTYERVDKERGEFFHTNWTGHGGKVSSGSYDA